MGRLQTQSGASADEVSSVRRSGPGRPKKMGPESVPIIKDSASRLFAKKGYTNTSLDEIAADVGFTKGGVYYYFRSKEQLLLDILNDIEARSIGETGRAMMQSTAPALERLVLFSDMQAQWASQYQSDLAILMLTSLETVNDTSKVGDRVRSIYSKMEALLTDTIDQAKRSGEIASGVSTRNMTLSIMAIHDGNILLWYRSGCDPETGRVLASIFKQTLLDRFKSLDTNSPLLA